MQYVITPIWVNGEGCAVLQKSRGCRIKLLQIGKGIWNLTQTQKQKECRGSINIYLNQIYMFPPRTLNHPRLSTILNSCSSCSPKVGHAEIIDGNDLLSHVQWHFNIHDKDIGFVLHWNENSSKIHLWCPQKWHMNDNGSINCFFWLLQRPELQFCKSTLCVLWNKLCQDRCYVSNPCCDLAAHSNSPAFL